MKQIILAVLVIGALLAPAGLYVSAHMTEGSGGTSQLWQIEEEIMGSTQHERMEELMEKMFDGALTDAEQKEIISLMRDPQKGAGAMSMMMRMMSGANFSENYKMMNWGGGYSNYWSWVFALVWIVWLVVGILAIVWLWKKVSKP